MVRKYLKDKYLSGAGIRENYIFCSVPEKVMEYAKASLRENPNSAQVCIFTVTKEDSLVLNRLLESCENIFQKAMISDIFFSTILLFGMKEHLENKNSYFLQNIYDSMKKLENGDLNEIVKSILQFPTSVDIKNIIKREDLFELNLFIEDMENKLLQQAINNYLDNDKKFSVKIFTDSDALVSYKMTNSFPLIHHHHYQRGPILDSGISLSQSGFVK